MGKYIKLFDTETEHQAYTAYTNSDYLEPYVSVTLDDNDVHYNRVNYLRFTAVDSDATIALKSYASNTETTSTFSIETSEDGLAWTSWDGTEKAIASGSTLLMRGNNPNSLVESPSSSNYAKFVMTGTISASGNIQSLLYGDECNYRLTIPCDYYYRNMFKGCTSLITAPELPATTLADHCYYDMFNGCTNLITAPELPATTLAEECYAWMFYGCTSLATAPELPAATLVEGCYYNMFKNCTSLTTAPELPATTLANDCYGSMFLGCSSLTTAPELPVTTLANGCYSYMFRGCTSLSTAPELPATTLAEDCYSYMFYGTNVLPDCSNIDFTSETVVLSGGLEGLFAGTKVTDSDLMNILPINPSTNKYYLPVTTLTESCYNSMFDGCTSLITAPELPATTLADYCYGLMFEGCTSLTTAPELPATILANYCYLNMFYGCTSLTTAPELPAMTLANNCYRMMFRNCTSLNYIKAMFTTTPSTTYTSNWVSGVASSGTFVKNSAATWSVTGVNGVPTGWTVQTASE